MKRPVLVIVTGLPGTGKTTLVRRLAADAKLPAFSRDDLYETMYDALERNGAEDPSVVGSAMFTLLYYVTGSVLAAGQSALVEGFFGNTELRTAEFLRLQQRHAFEPLQIICRADGKVLLDRFLARMESEERHAGHQDLAWIEAYKERLLQGHFTPLALDGRIIEIDTTTPHSFAYDDLLQQVRAAL